jgi:hypothetical protein
VTICRTYPSVTAKHILLCLCYQAVFLFASPAGGNEPVGAHELVERIASAGKRTAAQAQKGAIAWKTSIELGLLEKQAEVVFVKAPQSRRITVTLNSQGKRIQLADILERDDKWYVVEENRDYQCRPYEALYPAPVLYHVIEMAELRALSNAEELQRLGKFESADESTATFRSLLTPPQKAQVRNLIEVAEKVASLPESDQSGDVKDDLPRLRQQLVAFKEVLANGLTWKVNLEHGYIAEFGLPSQRITVEKYQALSDIDPELFDKGDEPWDDRSGALLIDDEQACDDVVMIAHAPAWHPGSSVPYTDTVLLNIKTGQIRRIPYQNGNCVPGCFSQDRLKVFLTGTLGPFGSQALFEVDLITGDHRRLGAHQLQGTPVSPALSPDGRTLVVASLTPGVHPPPDDKPFDIVRFQLSLVDIASGNARPLGTPLDIGEVNWLPDGSGLILVTRKYQSKDTPSLDTISRMDLAGNVTELRPGSHPELVLNGTRILYEDQQSQRWFTCDLNGDAPSLIGDGLSEFGFPAASSKGDRLVMMYMGDADSKGPRPFIVDVRSGNATPIEVGEGFWAIPRWK